MTNAIQRTLTVSAFDLPVAPLLSVTASLALKVPTRVYACEVTSGIAPAVATLPAVTVPSPHSSV